MKNIKLIIVFLLGILAQNAIAQQPKDSKGHIINAKGQIYFDGVKMGFISKDSLIKNNNGKTIAFVKSDGSLEDANGKSMGRVNKSTGIYYNENGAVVLSTKNNTDSETCNVLDANGKKIGNVHNSYKGVACALHCFQNKMDMQTHSKIKK